jgi:hypothetical protein
VSIAILTAMGALAAIIARSLWLDPRYLFYVPYETVPQVGVLVVPGALLCWMLALVVPLTSERYAQIIATQIIAALVVFVLVGTIFGAIAVAAGAPVVGGASYWAASAIGLAFLVHAWRRMPRARPSWYACAIALLALSVGSSVYGVVLARTNAPPPITAEAPE